MVSRTADPGKMLAVHVKCKLMDSVGCRYQYLDLIGILSEMGSAYKVTDGAIPEFLPGD
jgi:hypothetical protein